MRARTLSAAAVLVLSAGVLSGCHTNVGVAATADGHRITESDVNGYLTPKAQAVGSGAQSVPARSFVLSYMIAHRAAQKVLGELPNGGPTKSKISSVITAGLAGRTAVQYAESGAGVHGYTASFDKLVVETQVLVGLVQQNNKTLDQLAAAVAPVKVNPRYGTWDPAKLFVDGSGAAGVPGYLKLQPTPVAAPLTDTLGAP